MERLVSDVRFALRRLWGSPGFTLAAILTLALGIGANTTIFSAVNALLLRPLPVRDPGRLVFLNNGRSINFSYPAYSDIRDRNDVLSATAAERAMPMNISIGRGNSLRMWGYEVTGNYFEMLGIQPLLGRLMRPDDDDKPGAHPVVVLSYGCWQRRFGSDPNVAGRRVKINGLDYTVLGVTRPGFRGTEVFFNSDVFVPMSMEAQIEPGNDWLKERMTHNVWVLARLKPGVAREQAEASLNRIAAQLARQNPADEGTKVVLSPPGLVGNALRGPVAGFATVLMGVAGLVLLLACVNLAGMLLARASDRRKEIAVRLAIGARRGQLVRQLLTESFVLAVAGGGAGLLVALWLTDFFRSYQPPFDLPVRMDSRIDLRVLLFTVVAAVAATFLCGLAPALQSTRADLVTALKGETLHDRLRRWHLRDALVAAQVALCLVLLVCSVLVVKSLEGALDLHIGFNPDHAVIAAFDVGLQGYTKQRGRAFAEEAVEKVRALPGIDYAGAISNMPLQVGLNSSILSIDGKPLPPLSKMVPAAIYEVSPGYFKAAGTRLMAGRAVEARDRAGAPLVAVVDETFARQFLPGENPIGKYFRMGRTLTGPAIEIVGVVEAGKYESLGEDLKPAVFRPFAQNYNSMVTLVARTALAPDQAVREIRGVVAAMDPALPLFNVQSLSDSLALPLFPSRVAAIVLGAFGLLAAALASTGVFALVAYAVSRRTREIGIRMALGARPGRVLRLVLRRTASVLGLGVTVGLAMAYAASPVFSAVLYGVSPRDLPSYALASLLIAIVSALACWYPVRRAMRIAPASALREE